MINMMRGKRMVILLPLIIIIVSLLCCVIHEFEKPPLKVKKVSCGEASFAIDENGLAWVWGNDYYALVGTVFKPDGTLFDVSRPYNFFAPSKMYNISKIKDIQEGNQFVLVLLEDGSLLSWGVNENGCLGVGNNSSVFEPTKILSLTNIIYISVGSYHCAAIDKDGSVWVWGLNESGQIGNGIYDNQNTPAKVPGIFNAIKVACGYGHTLALTEKGEVWAWGDNFYGQLGYGESCRKTNAPVQVAEISNIVDIAVGTSHSLALERDGSVWSWGDDINGQLGLNRSKIGKEFYPCRVDLNNVISISAKGSLSCALKIDGTVWLWGLNVWFVDGDYNQSWAIFLPEKIEGFEHVIQVSTGYNHIAAIDKDFRIWTWGSNENGELGIGIKGKRKSPVRVELYD